MRFFLSSSTGVEAVRDSKKRDFEVSKISCLILAQVLPWVCNSVHLGFATCKMEASILPFNLQGKNNGTCCCYCCYFICAFTRHHKKEGRRQSQPFWGNLGKQQAGEMSGQLAGMLFSQWDPSSVPSTHTGDSPQPLITPALQDLTPTSGLQGYCMDMPYSPLNK